MRTPARKEQGEFYPYGGISMAYTAFAAGETALERLTAEGMEDLYRTIELPSDWYPFSTWKMRGSRCAGRTHRLRRG